MPDVRLGSIEIYNHVLMKNRFLNPVEGLDLVVHHINGVKWDNRVTNLQIITNEMNLAYGHGWGRGVVRYLSVASCCRHSIFIIEGILKICELFLIFKF